MDDIEVMYLINQAELHLRNARTELAEAGRAINAIRRAF